MKLAIMQPYLFPYIGYFQLMAAVDKFVFYDDVNFIKNGWINRNRLFLAGDVRYITIPLTSASSFLKINQIVVQSSDVWRKKISESIRHSYSKAPYFPSINNIICDVLSSGENKISNLAKNSVIAIADYLGLKTRFVMSSALYKNENLNGVARVLDICHEEKANQYYNLPGGKDLYDEKLFKLNGMDLCFIRPELKGYRQFSTDFHPGLSIIDVLMFNDRDIVREMLNTK